VTEADARRYHRSQLVLSLVSGATQATVLAGWIGSGAATGLATAVAERVPAPFPAHPVTVAVVLGAIGGSSVVAAFPLDVLGGFVLPRRAGLLVQSGPSWLRDRAKAHALAGTLTLAAVEVVYAFLAASPRFWWLWAAATLGLGILLLAAAVPVAIAPLFFRLTPLGDADLRERVLALAARVGVPAAEVRVADLSRKGRAANAAVVGLGRTRRILVSDTLLADFPRDEIEVVLAHELAHHARGHLWRGLALQVTLLLGVLWAAHWTLGAWSRPLGFAGPADPAGVPFLVLVLSGLGLLATPGVAAWSRRLEREADAIALEVTRAPAAFVAAMERLGALNLVERRPGRLRTWLTATHPTLEQRIAFARAAAERASGPA
jgi:STE24 endopeptidase